MPWLRLALRAAPTDELRTGPKVRALNAALGVAPIDRFLAGFPAFFEGPRPDAAVAASLGVDVEPMTGPPSVFVNAPCEPIARAWDRLRGFFERVAPEALTSLGPPALVEDVRHVEIRLGTPLPEEFRAWLAMYDGQTRDYGPFDWTLQTLVQSLSTKKMLDDMVPEFDGHGLAIEAGPGVRPRWWHPGWFPFASNGAGDHLCLDLDPTTEGQRGQVIAFRHDHEGRPLVAASFSEWLQSQAHDVERGSLVVLENGDGSFFSVLPRASLRGALVELRIRGESADDRVKRLQRYYDENPQALAVCLVERLRSAEKMTRGTKPHWPLVCMRVSEALGGGRAAVVKALQDASGAADVSVTAEEIDALMSAIRRGD